MRNTPAAHVSEGLGFANQYTFAWPVLDVKAGGLYVEIPFNYAGHNQRKHTRCSGRNFVLVEAGIGLHF